MSDRVLGLKFEELIEDEEAFLPLDGFACLVANELTFPPEPSRKRAIGVGRVAAKSSRVIKAIRKSHSGEPFRPTAYPIDVKSALCALIPRTLFGRELGIVKEDCSAGRTVQIKLRRPSRAWRRTLRRGRITQEGREGLAERPKAGAVEYLYAR